MIYVCYFFWEFTYPNLYDIKIENVAVILYFTVHFISLGKSV